MIWLMKRCVMNKVTIFYMTSTFIACDQAGAWPQTCNSGRKNCFLTSLTVSFTLSGSLMQWLCVGIFRVSWRELWRQDLPTTQNYQADTSEAIYGHLPKSGGKTEKQSWMKFHFHNVHKTFSQADSHSGSGLAKNWLHFFLSNGEVNVTAMLLGVQNQRPQAWVVILLSFANVCLPLISRETFRMGEFLPCWWQWGLRVSIFTFIDAAVKRFYGDMLHCSLKLLVKEGSLKSIKAPL